MFGSFVESVKKVSKKVSKKCQKSWFSGNGSAIRAVINSFYFIWFAVRGGVDNSPFFETA